MNDAASPIDEFIIPARHGRAFEVAKGQIFRIHLRISDVLNGAVNRPGLTRSSHSTGLQRSNSDRSQGIISEEAQAFMPYHVLLRQRTKPHPSGSSKQTALPFQ